MAETLGLAASGTDKSASSLAIKTVAELPSATADFAGEVWKHPGEFGKHALTELGTSAVMGAAIGYIVPAKGPAAALVAAAFTVPMVIHAVGKFVGAYQDLQKPNSNIDTISHKLAGDTVASTVDLGINLGGGYLGTEIGFGLSKMDNSIGAFSQSAQRGVLRGENEGMLGMKGFIDNMRGGNKTSSNLIEPGAPGGDLPNGLPGSKRGGIINTQLDEQLTGITAPATRTPESATFWQRPFAQLGRRLDQYSLVASNEQAMVAGSDELQLYFGSTHGHSRYSDGMGLPKDLYAKAMKEGQQVTTITDHNHKAARGGVKPDDPRAADQANTPTVAENPIEYAQTQADAAATTVNGQHVSLYGIEMGTIGGPPHSHGGAQGEIGDVGLEIPGGGEPPVSIEIPNGKPTVAGPEAGTPAITAEGTSPGTADGAPAKDLIGNPQPTIGNAVPDAATSDVSPQSLLKPFDYQAALLESLSGGHLGGVNHINVLEVPTFFEAIRQPRTGMSSLFSSLTARLTGGDVAAATTVVKAPDVIQYNDGDYAGLAKHLAGLKDSTGGTPIITLNHPRFLADSNPNLPVEYQGRDYGRKSFKSDAEWRTQFVQPYVRGIELIKGGALNPSPVDTVPTGMIDLKSYLGYLDLGVEAGPVFGRDFHFGDPVGNPGATGFLAKSLDKGSILDAMRERRTIATTSHEKLNGYLMANDKFYMGAKLDQAAVHDLSLKMKVGGNIDPAAEYTVNLYGDKVLDGKLGDVVQTRDMTGQELLDANGSVGFDSISHKLGDNSFYFVEVLRKDPTSGFVDKMYTSPIWLQPLSGAKHGLLTRLSAGSLLYQYLPSHTFGN